MAVIRFADAQRATTPVNPKPIIATRSSDLSQIFCTDLTMLREVEESELSPVAFTTTARRLPLSLDVETENIPTVVKRGCGLWWTSGVAGKFARIEAICNSKHEKEAEVYSLSWSSQYGEANDRELDTKFLAFSDATLERERVIGTTEIF